MTSKPFDVAVVGAGPAGATAAILLRKRGLSVVLVDRETFPEARPRADWISARAEPLLSELGLKPQQLKAVAIRQVTFYRGDFSQSANPSFDKPPAYLIDRAEFSDRLVNRATTTGAKVVEDRRAVDVVLGEHGVSTRLDDGTQVSSRLLLLAGGSDANLGERVGVTVGPSGTPVWIARIDSPLATVSAPKQSRVAVVLGLDQGSSFGMCSSSRGRLSISVHWYGEKAATIPTLANLCRQAAEHGVVPSDHSGDAVGIEVIPSRAAAALDMDSHVGKHTLVIGARGGFVSAASGESIFPAMWSARIAVDVIESALQTEHSQDALMTFDSAWRMEMADYLRPPHTDVQFLLPLVFSNQPLADRMGAAFFHGENI